jgi:hypothetical protein
LLQLRDVAWINSVGIAVLARFIDRKHPPVVVSFVHGLPVAARGPALEIRQLLGLFVLQPSNSHKSRVFIAT